MILYPSNPFHKMSICQAIQWIPHASTSVLFQFTPFSLLPFVFLLGGGFPPVHPCYLCQLVPCWEIVHYYVFTMYYQWHVWAFELSTSDRCTCICGDIVIFVWFYWLPLPAPPPCWLSGLASSPLQHTTTGGFAPWWLPHFEIWRSEVSEELFFEVSFRSVWVACMRRGDVSAPPDHLVACWRACNSETFWLGLLPFSAGGFIGLHISGYVAWLPQLTDPLCPSKL